MTPGGTTIRVKYSDGSKDGNREIFSAVVAAKLLWALGFVSDPIYPITLDCRDCPANPMSGEGPRAKRSYLATFQPEASRLVIVDGDDADEGWRWGEVDEAIANLPEGALRARQRMHFDALTLLGVFIQHGDRKPEQQRLECRGALDPSAGDTHPLEDKDDGPPVFFERPDGSACSEPVIALQDIGATFGGAGKMSKASTAKMNLKAWTNRPVFKPAKSSSSGGVPECHGNLTVSMAAGEGGRGDPRIGEAGRAFLAGSPAPLDRRTRARAHGDGPRREAGRISGVARSEDRNFSYRVGRVGRRLQGQGAADHRAALRAVTTAGRWPFPMQLDRPRTAC